MKILQVSSSLARDQGGPTEFALALHRAFRDLGVDHTLITTDYNGVGRLEDDERAELTSQGVEIFAGTWPRALKNSADLKRFVKDTVSSYDVVHVDGLFLGPSAACASISWAASVPFVVAPHGGLEPFQRSQHQLRKNLFDLTVGRALATHAAGYVFTGPMEAERATFPAGRAFSVVSLGAEYVAKRPIVRVEQWRAELSPRRIVLFLGRLAEKKQPLVLLEAWKQAGMDSKGYGLIIAGPDDYFSLHDIEVEKSRLGLANSVIATGAVSRNEAAFLYDLADAFCLPSLNENFGMTVSEAMLHECVVLATPEVAALEHASAASCAILIQGTDSKAIASALTALAEMNDQELARWAVRGHLYATDNLTWSGTARGLLDFYLEILGGLNGTGS